MALVDPQQQLAAPATLGQALVVQARMGVALVEMLEEPVELVEMLELVELVEVVQLQAVLEGLAQQQAEHLLVQILGAQQAETLLLEAIKLQAARREGQELAAAQVTAPGLVM